MTLMNRDWWKEMIVKGLIYKFIRRQGKAHKMLFFSKKSKTNKPWLIEKSKAKAVLKEKKKKKKRNHHHNKNKARK